MLLINYYKKRTFFFGAPYMRFVSNGYFVIPRMLKETGITMHYYFTLNANSKRHREMAKCKLFWYCRQRMELFSNDYIKRNGHLDMYVCISRKRR